MGKIESTTFSLRLFLLRTRQVRALARLVTTFALVLVRPPWFVLPSTHLARQLPVYRVSSCRNTWLVWRDRGRFQLYLAIEQVWTERDGRVPIERGHVVVEEAPGGGTMGDGRRRSVDGGMSRPAPSPGKHLRRISLRDLL